MGALSQERDDHPGLHAVSLFERKSPQVPAEGSWHLYHFSAAAFNETQRLVLAYIGPFRLQQPVYNAMTGAYDFNGNFHFIRSFLCSFLSVSLLVQIIMLEYGRERLFQKGGDNLHVLDADIQLAYPIGIKRDLV